MCNRQIGILRARNLFARPSAQEGTMVSNPNEKWMEYCELAAKEQNPKKLIALMAEIGRLLRERADAAREESATSHY
jgi:hypothetical protein